MTQQEVQDALASTNLVIATDNSLNPSGQFGDIFVKASVSWSTNNSLTLSAYRDINISNGVSTQITNTASGDLVLRADSTGTGTGAVHFQPSYYENYGPGGHVNFSQSTGTVSIFYNPPGDTQ